MEQILKSKLLVGGIILVLLVVGFTLLKTTPQEESPILQQQATGEKVLTSEQAEILKNEADAEAGILFLSGIVLELDADNNFLVMKAADDLREVKVVLSGDTKVTKVVGLHLQDASFSDIQEASYISVKSKTPIEGRREINDVVEIEVLD